MEVLHKRLKEARQIRNLNQYEISEKLGIKQPTWHKYESGKSSMNIETFYKICKTLDVSSDWLLGFTDNMVPLCAQCHDSQSESETSVTIAALHLQPDTSGYEVVD